MNNKEIFVKIIGRLVDLGLEKTCDDHYNKFSYVIHFWKKFWYVGNRE